MTFMDGPHEPRRHDGSIPLQGAKPYFRFHPATHDSRPWIESECCGDDIDEEAARAIIDNLQAWLNGELKPPPVPEPIVRSPF